MHFSSTHQVIVYLKNKKVYILSGGILSVIIYFAILFNSSSKTYKSSAIVYNTNKGNSSHDDQTVQGTEDGYTIINWVYSTELIDHLIKRFKLYNHYNIDSTKKDAYAICFNAASNNIAVSMTAYNAVKITAYDEDRIFAAEIANEILTQVDHLNEQMAIARKKQVVHEYELLLEELSHEVNSQRDSIKALAISLSRLKSYSEKIKGTVNLLTQTSLDYEKLASEWLNTRKSYLFSLKYLEKYNLPSFVIIQHALPEIPESSYSFANFGFGLIAFLGGGWIVIFILIAAAKYASFAKNIINPSFGLDQDANDQKVVPIDYLHFKHKQPEVDTENSQGNEKQNA